MGHPLLYVMMVLAILCGMLGVLAVYRRLYRPHPELLRKCLHVTMGSVTLSFPWLFDEIWPVMLLGALSITLLACLRLVPSLQKGVGQVLHGVSRFSLGELYFVVAVAALWVLYMLGPSSPPGRRLLVYLVPLLLLTFADSSAALVGVYLGRWRYATPDGTRSYEGSVAFFVCALLCTHVPLLLLTDRGWEGALLLAVFIACLTTLCEAVAWGGLDNLVLPSVSYLLLSQYWDLPGAALLVLAAAVGCGLVLARSWRPALATTGAGRLPR